MQDETHEIMHYAVDYVYSTKSGPFLLWFCLLKNDKYVSLGSKTKPEGLRGMEQQQLFSIKKTL